MPVTPTLRLGPVSYVVLGLISLRGRSTPYDLKRAADTSVRYFWEFPHSQIYAEAQRLAEAGLLDAEVEVSGRRRKLYALTAKGHDALADWLDADEGGPFEMRDEAVLRLFFSDGMTTETLVSTARVQVASYDARLRDYDAIAARQRPRHGNDRRMAPLDLGVMLAQTCRTFWQQIVDDPPPSCRHSPSSDQ